MGEITEKEDEWQDKATAAAIAGARKIALSSNAGLPAMTPVGRLTEHAMGLDRHRRDLWLDPDPRASKRSTKVSTRSRRCA